MSVILEPLDAGQLNAALALVWSVLGLFILILIWPGGKGRRVARQIFALAVLGFREGVRQNVLWMMCSLAVIAGSLAYFSDADGTHAGRARLIIETCLSTGELLGASLIVLLSALSVSREIESRIMYTLGTKPVPRFGILAGKALGFWCVELVFALMLTLFTAALVRAVPLRPESREQARRLEVVGQGESEGDQWQRLRRDALITRTYKLPENEGGGAASFAAIKPGQSKTFEFDIDRRALHGEALELRFQLLSNMSFSPVIPDVRMKVGYAAALPVVEKVVFERTLSISQDRPFSVFIAASELDETGRLRVTLGASPADKFQTSILVSRQHGVRAGIAADGLSGNLGKSFVLLALQGWILALITTAWSGVLSFPVTVALGLLLVLGGELSRQALLLLQSNSDTMLRMAVGAREGAADEGVKLMTAYIVSLLEILPDFRTAGGPAAFIDGNFISGWTLAYAAFWMGIVRALCWSLPGVLSFQGREVGA